MLPPRRVRNALSDSIKSQLNYGVMFDKAPINKSGNFRNPLSNYSTSATVANNISSKLDLRCDYNMLMRNDYSACSG